MNNSFKKLIEQIQLTPNQEQDAITKYTGVCKVLQSNYYPDQEYYESNMLLIGSYGKYTNIRPPRDIDIVFILSNDDFSRIDNLAGNKQSQLLQEVRKLLIKRYPLTEEIKVFGKVVVVPFSEGTHSVEVLPAFALPDGSFKIPNTTNNGSWEISNPRAEMKNISESENINGLTIDFIKICKKWAEYCNVEIQSFILEILVVNYLSSLNNIATDTEYPKLIHDFFVYLLKQVNSSLLRPTGDWYSLGNVWESKAISARDRSAKAIAFEASGNLDDAVGEWQKIFSDEFQLSSTEATKSLKEKVNDLAHQYPSAREEFLDETYGIPFAINPSYRVKIDAEISQNGFRTTSLRNFIRQNFRLKKFKHLVFTITTNTVPEFDKIMWKVRNFGEEAKALNQLRGEITEDAGLGKKRESTKYFGDHYVECYIIKQGKCVALNSILVPIGNE